MQGAVNKWQKQNKITRYRNMKVSFWNYLRNLLAHGVPGRCGKIW